MATRDLSSVEADKKFFEYANEVMDHAKNKGRPTYPIEKVIMVIVFTINNSSAFLKLFIQIKIFSVLIQCYDFYENCTKTNNFYQKRVIYKFFQEYKKVHMNADKTFQHEECKSSGSIAIKKNSEKQGLCRCNAKK